MMQVTRLQPISKNRYRVYLDGEIAFVLYKGDLNHYHIREGAEIAETTYEKIVTELLPERARARLLHLLDKMDYTEMQLRRKLVEGNYPQQAADVAICKLKEYHFVDDERYARRYIEYKLAAKTTRQIYADLCSKGIRRETIEKAFTDCEEEGLVPDEFQIATDILRKRHYDALHADEKEKARQIRYLLGKGISLDTAKKALIHEAT